MFAKENKKHAMQDTTLLTTISGVIGGITKAILSGFAFLSISLSNLLEIAVYAFVSATVGYGVKLFYDYLRKTGSENTEKKS